MICYDKGYVGDVPDVYCSACKAPLQCEVWSGTIGKAICPNGHEVHRWAIFTHDEVKRIIGGEQAA